MSVATALSFPPPKTAQGVPHPGDWPCRALNATSAQGRAIRSKAAGRKFSSPQSTRTSQEAGCHSRQPIFRRHSKLP